MADEDKAPERICDHCECSDPLEQAKCFASPCGVESDSRADLAAPKVKPLSWDEHNWIASTGFGYVRIEHKPAGWWNSLTKSYEPTMHAAKAAAQADYERRILKALE